jgi:hypothetical protein
MAENKLYTKPGDRGDDSCKAGIAKLKSGYSGNLSGKCSKGYESVESGWAGKVKR